MAPKRVALAVAAGLLIAACRHAEPAPGIATVLLTGDVVSLDPNQFMEHPTDAVLSNVYEPLVGLDEDLRVRAVLAESWEHPRAETWRFRLRKGIRFQDGTPLTAEVVRSALLSIHEGARVEAAPFTSGIERISVVDEHTLDLVTAEPRALLADLTFLYVAKPNASGGFPPLVGTGPYRISDGAPGGSLLLTRWEGYRGPKPAFRQVRFVPVPSAVDRVERLAREPLAVAYGVAPEQALRPHPSVRFLHRAGLSVYYLGLNLRPTGPQALRDPRVRRALSLALDRRAMVEEILHGRGTVATQPVAPEVFGYNPDLPRPGLDRGEARRLLRAAGYGAGFKLRLDIRKPLLDLGRRIQQDLAGIGVQVELNGLSREGVYELARRGESDFFLAGWDCTTGEASEFYEFLLHSPGKRYGQGNYGGYSNPEVDRIAETNAAILDPIARRGQLEKAATMVMHDLPILPLYVQDETYGIHGKLTFTPRADAVIRLEDLKPLEP